MLVLSRKTDEEIVINVNGTTLSLKVVEIRGDKVRIGFNAPKTVSIWRKEVAEAIEREGGKK